MADYASVYFFTCAVCDWMDKSYIIDTITRSGR